MGRSNERGVEGRVVAVLPYTSTENDPDGAFNLTAVVTGGDCR